MNIKALILAVLSTMGIFALTTLLVFLGYTFGIGVMMFVAVFGFITAMLYEVFNDSSIDVSSNGTSTVKPETLEKTAHDRFEEMK